MKACKFMFILFLLVLSSGCQKSDDKLAAKKRIVSFYIPEGWVIKTQDSIDSGSMCMLVKQIAVKEESPAICIWIGDYANKLSETLTMKPAFVMALMPVVGLGQFKDTFLSSKVSIIMTPNLNQKTEHTFMDFDIPRYEFDASVAAIFEDKNKSNTFFTISLAAKPSSIDETKVIADSLITHILTQLNQFPDKTESWKLEPTFRKTTKNK